MINVVVLLHREADNDVSRDGPADTKQSSPSRSVISAPPASPGGAELPDTARVRSLASYSREERRQKGTIRSDSNGHDRGTNQTGGQEGKGGA